MKTVAIIQARLSSTRLPGKSLMDIEGRPMLGHVVRRTRAIQGVDEVVVAAPTEADARAFRCVAAAENVTVLWFNGIREADVMARYFLSAEKLRAHTIVRITSDCPLLDPRVAEKVLRLFFSMSGIDYAGNDTTRSGYPDGSDVDVFTHAALARAHSEAVAPSDREHIRPWMLKNVRCALLESPDMWLGPKLSVDTIEDLERVRAIVRALPDGDLSLSATRAAARQTLGSSGR